MNALAQLQRDFQSYVLSNCDNGEFSNAVIGTSRATSDERLHVYTHAYAARLAEILGNDFLGLHALVGAEKFEDLCRHYIEETPSHYYNARWYGERLTAFLRVTTPWADCLGLSEMAELDWTIGLSFDAQDENFVTEAVVAAIPAEDWPDMSCKLHSSIRRLFHCWNVGEIRRAIDRDETIPPLRNRGVPQPWIVSRQDHVVRFRYLEEDESAALDAVQQGASFSEICELLCEWHDADVVAMRAATLFKAWIQNQWIAELNFPNERVVE